MDGGLSTMMDVLLHNSMTLRDNFFYFEQPWTIHSLHSCGGDWEG